MATKKSNPKLLEWNEVRGMSKHSFNEYHGTNIENWSEVLPKIYDTPEERYEQYKVWFMKNCTKLGKALE